MRYDIVVAFSDFTGYTGKPKGVDEDETICPARQDKQTSAQDVGRRKTNALAGQTDHESHSKQEGLRP